MMHLRKKLRNGFLLLTILIGGQQTFAQCSFNLQQDTGCIPFPVLGLANDTAAVPAIVSRAWSLTTCAGPTVFNATPGLNPTFSYIPSTPGCYNLCMTSTNSLGQTCNYCVNNILVSDTPQPIGPVVFPTSFCAPQTVTLNMNNSPGCGVITQTQIQWGCGNITTVNGPVTSTTHPYTTFCNPQCYNVNIVLRNSCGCVGTKKLTNAVCVLAKPVANFTVDVSSGVCVNSLTSNFTASYNGPGFTYTWYVNGAQQQSSSSLTFQHTFPAAFNCYQIKLIAANTAGCADTLVRDNFICVFAAPHLSFTQDTTSLCVDSGQTGLLCLQNTSLPFLPNPIWRVRGGNPLVNLGPFTGDSICIPINNAGIYQVTLIGSYGPGCTDSLVVPNAFNLKQNPNPCFFASDSFSCQPFLSTAFINCSSAPPGSTYLWNFGAGAVPLTSTAINPTPPNVFYGGLGKRDVSLAITSSNGCFKLLKKTNYIVVDTITPFILVSNGFGCAPLLAIPQSVTNVPAGFAPHFISNYEWWIYNNSTGALEWHQFGSAFAHTFNTPGCYKLKLKITTDNGCVTTTWLDSALCVGAPPVCSMTVNPDTMCYEADSVVFNVGGPGCNADRFIVHFGDETDPSATSFITSSPFVHTYQSFGEFDAWVVPVQDSCEGDSMTAHIVVYPPAASFSSSTSCLSGDTVCFANGANGANRYHWNFGCAPDTFNTFSPCLILPHCDTCTVTLTAYNDTTHCVHHKTQLIQTACGNVNATATPAYIQDCNQSTATYTNTTPGASSGQTYWFTNPYSPGCSFVPPCAFSSAISTPMTWFFGEGDIAMLYIAPGGCRDTVWIHRRVCGLTADFTPTGICLPDSFHFAPIGYDNHGVSGCDTIVAWAWDFGGGDLDSTQFPVRTFPLGAHSVRLTITNSFGCTATIVKIVTSGTPVYALWNVDTNICPGSTVAVTNSTSSGVSLIETWEFPGSNFPFYNGHTPPSLTYNTPGDYLLVYTVSGGTCYRSDTVTMHVHNPILSGYLDTTYASCPPLPVCATNTSQWVDQLTDIYTWDFGNGEYLEVNPCDFYGFPGCYPVTLSVVTNNGCRDTVFIDSVCVDGPYGSIGHSPMGICSCKDSVDFIVSSVKATELTFVYGCNQGFKIENPIFPIGTDLNPHTFNYRIPYCLTDSCLPQVTFGDATGCHVLYNDSILYVDSPVVAIAFNNFGICLSGTVNFFDATTFALPPNISYNTQWSWDFGDPFDPTPSTDSTPTHYYSQPGAFPVTFRVTSNFGCYDSIVSTSVVVIPKFPIAGFYADASLVCAETPICFHDTSYVDSVTGPQFWYWDFGDGNTDSVSGANPCHTYMAGGFYTVHLCLYDSIGCGDCDSGFVIQVISKPIADAGPDTVFCYGVQAQLNGSGAVACQWSPPNLVSNPAICNPTTILFQDTSFILTVTDVYGCIGVDTLNVLVGRVFANFTVPANACLEDSVCVTDASASINGVITNWLYAFGDGGTTTGANSCYLYSIPAIYSIFETVTDNHGCVDTTSRPVIIFPQPMAAFSLNDTVVCSNAPVCYTDFSTSITAIQNWTWDFGANQVGYSGQNPPCHLYTPPYLPNYTIVLAIADQNGCLDTASIIVTVNETPQANFSWSTSCEDTYMPLANTSANGDGAIDSCTWLLWVGAPSPVNDYNCNTSFLFPPGYHDVQLIVHDLNGCLDTIVKTVFTDSLSQLVIYPGDTTICLGTSVDYSVSGVFDNIVWTPSVWLSDPYSAVVTVTPLGNVGYIISAVNGVCNSDNDTFAIQVIQPIPIDVMAVPDRIVLGLSSNITSQIPAPIDSIVWTPDSTLDCRNCLNPVATPIQTTTYCATIYYGKNGVTCFNSACVTITVLNSCNESIVYLPNTFTPNGDGINDIFMIRGIAATRVNYFRVFDRWGKLVYESLNGEANQTLWGWDGTDRTGEKLNPAVFVYTYEIECINGDIVTGNGNVTLVR